MTPEERNRLVREFLDKVCLPLMGAKGHDYAQADITNDALANFKRAASRWGVTVEQAIGVYMGKHMDAIETFIRRAASGAARQPSEPIELRVADLVNYALLLYCWLVEAGVAAEPPRAER